VFDFFFFALIQLEGMGFVARKCIKQTQERAAKSCVEGKDRKEKLVLLHLPKTYGWKYTFQSLRLEEPERCFIFAISAR